MNASCNVAGSAMWNLPVDGLLTTTFNAESAESAERLFRELCEFCVDRRRSHPRRIGFAGEVPMRRQRGDKCIDVGHRADEQAGIRLARRQRRRNVRAL